MYLAGKRELLSCIQFWAYFGGLRYEQMKEKAPHNVDLGVCCRGQRWAHAENGGKEFCLAPYEVQPALSTTGLRVVVLFITGR